MATAISYQTCLKSMYGLRRFGIKLGLSTISKILAGLGNPQDSYHCIHVAGTNGKGSVASSLASVLTRAGYKTGLYTSPHLIRFNERIQVNKRPITNTAVLDAYKAISEVHSGNREPTFFEFATVMAFFEFARQKVDWAIIETGMGGRLDATNIIRPRISIITNISLEHREYLGNTLEQISAEKAGIIKNRTPVITGIRQKKALAVVQKTARDKSAPVYRLGKDFRVRRHPSGTFSYYGRKTAWPHLKTGLRGRHQVDNAALVLAACELLKDRRLHLSMDDIQTGLIQNRWPGRLEIVSDKPLIILDGAHNFIAARNLARFLAANFRNRNIILIIGILDDKPYKAMLNCLLPTVNRVIFTRAKINRAMQPEKLEAIARKRLPAVAIVSNVKQALEHGIKIAAPNDVICVAGSLYVVGEAKAALDRGLLKK